MQRVGMRLQHLVALQNRRIAHHVDAVELRLDDGVLESSARTARIAQHKSESVAAVMYPVAAYHRIDGAAHHDAVGGEVFELVALDDRLASVLGHYSHRRSAAHVVAAHHGAGAEHVDGGLLSAGKVVALDRKGDVAGDYAAATAAEVILAHVDG